MARNIFSDIANVLPHYVPSLIFDIGANVGQTTSEVLRSYPSARVRAFEPINTTYEMLVAAHGANPNVKCENFAFGKREGSSPMVASPGGVTNRIVPEDAKPHHNRQMVQITTGDVYCKENDINNISILKIDTEGFDLNVLVGFSSIISRHGVDFIQVEAGANPTNTRHVSIRDFLGYLEPVGYSLFGLYDPAREAGGVPRLRRVNLGFISDTCVERVREKPS